jgi:hypothetical protein
MNVKAYGSRNVQELNNVESSLALFVFGNERLRFTQSAGDVGLGQACRFSLSQQ